MPVAYTEIPEDEIVKALKDRGYGQELRRRFHRAFNKPTGRKFDSGGEVREFAFGLTAEQWGEICRYSRDAYDAANRAEHIGLGRQLPSEPSVVADYQQSPGITMEVAERLISNRVSSSVASAVEPINRAINDLAEMVRGLSATMPKKMGRPKGSKNKPKPGTAGEAPAS
jgi:hypothetical protein